MAYASFKERERPVNNAVNEPSFNLSKALAKVYGYMFLGLLITAVVCFFVSWLFSSHINALIASGGNFDSWGIALVATWVVSGIILLVLSFVIPMKAAFGKGSLWVPYILYSICMGLLLTVVLLSGISFYVVGEAFAITTVAFGAMALIGIKSKKDLSVLGFLAMALLLLVLLVGLVGIILLAVNGWKANQVFWFDIGISAAVVGILLIVTMVDSWRIKKILLNSGDCENMCLYGAFVMYSDFISILIRVLYILSKLQRR